MTIQEIFYLIKSKGGKSAKNNQALVATCLSDFFFINWDFFALLVVGDDPIIQWLARFETRCSLKQRKLVVISKYSKNPDTI